MNPSLKITNEMLDVVLNHIRDDQEHVAKVAEKIGIEYHSLEFIQLMDHLCDRNVIQKIGSTYLITFYGRQFKGFVTEARELNTLAKREEEKKKRDEERDKYDLLAKRFFYRWRWTPWIMSFIAIVVSVFTYFKKSDSMPTKIGNSAATVKKDTTHTKLNLIRNPKSGESKP